MGLYRPPSFLSPVGPKPRPIPPHTISSVPVHTAEWFARGLSAPSPERGVQVSVDGLYRAPSPTIPLGSIPPQMIISLPVQTALCRARALGGAPPASGTS